MRNPWKWSFDPLNGDLWAGEVGQDHIEEVDLVSLGGNYGWSSMEGPSGTNNGKMILPVFSYDHNVGTCIIGGVVFRGNTASKYYGTYFVADINTKKFWALKKNGTGLATVEELPPAPTNISSFGTDADGRIYMVGMDNGTIYSVESPDLNPAVNLRSVTSPLLRRYSRVFTAARGGHPEAGLFRRGARLEIFGMDGNRFGALDGSDARLPDRLVPGFYLARAYGGRSLPDLLLVR